MAHLGTMLERVRSGEIDYGEFVRGTRRDYRAMALYLMRRWSTPAWLVVDDVEQELYLETWRVVWAWDPRRGPSITGYVVFNAMSATKRAMHKARGVSISGSPDHKASCFERPLSSFDESGEPGNGEALMNSILAEAPRAEDLLLEAEARRLATSRALKTCRSKRERYAVLAVREAGALDAAARVLYDDVDHRLSLRLGSEEHAERFIARHAGAVARRIDG